MAGKGSEQEACVRWGVVGRPQSGALGSRLHVLLSPKHLLELALPMASQARTAPCRDYDMGGDTQGCVMQSRVQQPFFEVKGDPMEVRLPLGLATEKCSPGHHLFCHQRARPRFPSPVRTPVSPCGQALVWDLS